MIFFSPLFCLFNDSEIGPWTVDRGESEKLSLATTAKLYDEDQTGGCGDCCPVNKLTKYAQPQ